MKKYVKPELFYERYELSQHIADCAWESNGNGTYSADENMFGQGTGWVLLSSNLGCTVIDGEQFCLQSNVITAYTYVS